MYVYMAEKKRKLLTVMAFRLVHCSMQFTNTYLFKYTPLCSAASPTTLFMLFIIINKLHYIIHLFYTYTSHICKKPYCFLPKVLGSTRTNLRIQSHFNAPCGPITNCNIEIYHRIGHVNNSGCGARDDGIDAHCLIMFAL
jgi:hypothetical protein